MNERSWREAWLTPIGAMVVLLVLNLGIGTFLALHSQDQRRRIEGHVTEHRLRNEAVHDELRDLLHCIVNVPREEGAAQDLSLEECFASARKLSERTVGK